MMASIRREDRIGLAVAFGLHAVLVLVFLMQPDTRESVEPAQRMTVNLASEVGLEAAAPVPVPESRAAIAPTLSDAPAPQPQPTPEPRLERPVAANASVARPRPSNPSVAPRPATKKGGGELVGKDFLAGMGGSTSSDETRAPASAIGQSVKASLLQAITREIKPHWRPPSGPDVDQITTFLRFRLNADGSLAGAPTSVRQTGVNDTNRPQAGRHRELAIRAVQLAAPFDLPEKYYEAWKVVGPLGFNLEIS